MSVVQWFAAGGVVMVPLLGCAIATIALGIERGRFWWQLAREQPVMIREALIVYGRDPEQAIRLLQLAPPHWPIVQIFMAAMALDRPSPEEFRLALDSAAQAQLPNLKRFSTVFDTIVGIAPLLGLLGTVLGLMGSFAALRWDSVGSTGGPNGAGIGAGLSEALVSTAAGLVVAISALLVANVFRSLYRRQLAAIAQHCGQLELLYRRYWELQGGVPFDLE
jgi:biopolymer transport protein ExbB